MVKNLTTKYTKVITERHEVLKHRKMIESKTDKWVFIVNPIAGNGFAKTLIPEIEKMIRKYNIDGEIVFTERIGHATELSKPIVKRDSNISSVLAVMVRLMRWRDRW